MLGEAYDVNIIFVSRQYKRTVLQCAVKLYRDLSVINFLQQYLFLIVNFSTRQSQIKLLFEHKT